MAGALTANNAYMARFVSIISAAEIPRSINNMFISCQAYLAPDGRHFEHLLFIKVSLIKSHYFLVYIQLRGDTPARDAVILLGVCGRRAVGDAGRR